MSTSSPTEGITCPHGALLPAALGPRSKRTAVPPPLWDYFKHSWQRAERRSQQQQAEAVSEAAAASVAAAEVADKWVSMLHSVASVYLILYDAVLIKQVIGRLAYKNMLA